ncbi:MAG TPA: 5-formyltetrahydrofolate cyclo-ligase [Longimicrobiaceae bacterium]|nr:5-formyltetrahydrofolate cyclo-ligase [Longimicrobiaceae bacterium]
MSKPAARRAARARLAALSDAERDRAGREVARRIWTVPEVASARVLLLYASLAGEVPTDAIAREAWRRGHTVTYPRCLPEARELALHRVHAPHELEAGTYGIREPALACPRVGLEEIDVALVPGLAWDRTGARLGRGAGYYDRLFARPGWRALRVGVFFGAQEAPDGVPVDAWDAPLEVIVTEREVWRPRG